ncbi:intermembrane lipid transfer protein VPS13B [Uranotaenia lowii]|uniref:intermembrane lipid transfer protein VPS13B n=1 Tax=Uranotaenia lowii TaxID=190385 RepID=UPI00247ADA36|nr:intermembrane lipid transfer protein VPS13B [Uranotaenia lowii]
MFKIESYITPIILSYVEKYVKNIRPEDSQVSLWGGEVVFQNLDLKLDVLEEELALPFQFLSGHIHELAIRVPWTKIASEPIVITINTIEFVLKLQEPDNRSVPRRDSSRKSRNSEETPPPGYMASLINRIANNITIRCHNVILKYVEEDIVVSMNIQQLSMESADNDWNPAFIDISPTRVSLRKLINIIDLTICLDKRNSAGKIEMCQEPVLYRSTLQARVLMKYSNGPNQDRSSITRIDIHSRFLDFNISSQQFPMLMRLFELGLALKQGKIKSEALPGQDMTAMDSDGTSGQDSLLTWAWNLLPSFFPEENESEHTDDHEFHVFHSGCYVDRMRMVFKTQEFIGDSIGTRKIKYSPFLQLDLNGVHGEVVICGLKWFNCSGGIAKIELQALDNCPCGSPLTIKEVFQSESVFTQSDQHMIGSFFDDKTGESKKYNINWNVHLGTFSQENLLKKSPAVAIDIIHEVQIPDDRKTSEIGSDLEFSNLSEKYMIRAFLGKFKLKIGADTLHRIKALVSYKDSYEYPPYYEEKPLPNLQQLPPPSAEDYDALMNEIPLKQVHITIVAPIIELHPFDHGCLTIGKKRSSNKLNQSSPNSFLSLEWNRIECNILTPLYPNRLVFTTCQLPEPPTKLFEGCFQSISGNLERLQLKLLVNNQELQLATAINLYHQHRFIIHEHLWPNAELNKVEHNYGISDLKLTLNPHQALLALGIISSLIDKTPSNPAPDLIANIALPTIPTLETSISHIQLRQITASETSCLKLTSRSLRCLSFIPCNASSQRSLAALWPDHPTEEDFLTIIVQLPTSPSLANLSHPPIFYGRFLDLSLNLDPLFLQFIHIFGELYQCSNDTQVLRTSSRHAVSPRKSVDRTLPPSKKSSQQPNITSVHSTNSDKIDSNNQQTKATATGHPVASGSQNQPMPTLAASTVVEEGNDCGTHPSKRSTEPQQPQSPNEVNPAFWMQLSRRIIFHLEFCHCTGYFPVKSIAPPEEASLERSPSQEDEFGDNQVVMLKLPLITVDSAFKSSSLSAGINQFPISLAKSVWPDDKDSYPWTVSLANASSWTYQHRQMNKLLDETTTNISLVLNFKEDELSQPASVCFHVDTSPMKLNVFGEQLQLLGCTLDRILSLSIFQKSNCDSEGDGKIKHIPALEIVQKSGNSTTAADLKDFLDMTHNSSGASDDTLKEGIIKSVIPVSIWLQWTFSKVTFNCFSKDDTGQLKTKLVIEMEDIIYSLDMQDVYLQIKAKIGGMNGHCFEWAEDEKAWKRNEALGLTVQTESGGSCKSANDTFLNLTITKAETANVHTKWETVRKNREQNESLIEIVLKIEHIDLRLDLDLLAQCIDILTIFQRKAEIDQPQPVLGVKDLPLVLFSSKGLRVYIPVRDGVEPYSAFIFKVSSITVHHNVENPICRVPLRADIYTKAAQMRILNVPGSKIEDRQYELLLRDISLTTALWSDILAFIQDQNSAALHHDNPAFKWNNMQDVQNSSELEVSTVFNDFHFSVIYAPCIIYKNVLICSQATELNCMTDLVVNLEMHQLKVAGQIIRKSSAILQMIKPPSAQQSTSGSSTRSSFVEFNPVLFSTNSSVPNQSNNDLLSLDSVKSCKDSEPPVVPRMRTSHSKLSDSGVESYWTSIDVKATSRRSASSVLRKNPSKSSDKLHNTNVEQMQQSSAHQQTVPYEVCFLGGLFKVNLYDRKCKDETTEPICRVVMVQPNGLLSLNLLEHVAQISIFDVYFELNNQPLLKTIEGKLDELGIPQPIMKARYVNNLAKKNNELNLDFKRPFKIKVSHQKIKTLLDVLCVLDITLGVSVQKPQSSGRRRRLPKPILGRNKFKLIRSHLYDIEKVNFSTSQALIHLQDENQKAYDCKLSLSSIRSSLHIHERPERIVFNLDLDELVVCQNSFTILHPFSWSIQASLTQEYWKRDPLVQIKINSGYLQLDCNPNNLTEFQRMADLFKSILLAKTLETKTRPPSQFSSVNQTPRKELLIPITAPGFPRKDSLNTSEEHYQDDLRAGAFQFIESARSNDLPLPYQIKIINRDVGIICWRYPQPRALSNVIVYPVPMNQPAVKLLSIQCRLEYYSEIHGEFFELCEFTLSENEKTNLRLPTRRICSATWRIVMTQNVIHENGAMEDETQDSVANDQGKSLISNITDVLKDTYLVGSSRLVSLPYRLHPKIFVACMRVDSLFNSNLVPNVEFSVELRPVQVNFFNQLNYHKNSKLPKPFDKYRICQESIEMKSHKFMTLNSSFVRIHGAICNNMNLLISGELNLHCDLLDYSHFTFESGFEMVNMKALAAVEENSLELKVISDDIIVRFGPSIGYNLLLAEKIWKSPSETVLLYGKYIICNNMHVSVRIGQCNTGESIFLGASELCIYVFRSYSHQQMLQVTFKENSKDIDSEPFSITKDGISYVKIQQAFEEDLEDDKLFVIRIESLSGSQKRITIEGQISFFNMTSQRLKVQYRFYKIIPNSDKNYVSTNFSIGERGSANIFGAANNKNQQSIKIALDGEKRGWSGDIPMREIMNGSKPYLVKIPTVLTKEGYMSYWVRIIREKIGGTDVTLKEKFNERVLVIVWPLFMVQSMLAVNTTAYEEKIDQNFSIYGQGERRQLIISGTNSDEHELQFRMNFNILGGEDKQKALLSYRLIDGRSFFQVPERFKTIENAIELLQQNHKLPWPCSREEELRWKRENSIQEATLPIYHCSAAHELSCSLMLSISPWCFFINQLGCPVRLKNYETQEVNIVEANNIVMPSYIENVFTFELDVGFLLKSELIYLKGEIRKLSSGSIILPSDGSVNICIRSENGIAQLVLTSITENNIRVLILAPQYVVVNYSTACDLRGWCFAVLANERMDQVRQDEQASHTAVFSLPRTDRRNENPQGTAVTILNNLSKHKNRLKASSNYNCYLTLYQDDGNDFSAPILLNQPLSRKSFSVQCDDRYVPLALSIITHQGQSFISIYDDPCPCFSIENRTDFNIYVAQADSNNSNKPAAPVPECAADSNFVWYQIVGSRQTVFYTPPEVDTTFPEVQEQELSLIFACVSGSAIRWSHPVKLDENKNIFLNVPLYGDLKLAASLKNRSTEIIIEYISQDLEFSAKDIRTRLLNPLPLSTDQSDSEVKRENQPSVHQKPSTSSAFIDHRATALPSKRISFRGFFKSFNVTLFNDQEQRNCSKNNLISINLDRIGVELNSAEENKAMIQFVNLQVDNELYCAGEYDFPVVLCSEDHERKQQKSTVIPNQHRLEECLEELAKDALCGIYLEINPESWTNVEGVRFKINPIRAYIEDTYINVLLDYLMECLPINLIYQPEQPVDRTLCPAGFVLIPKLVSQQSSYLADPIKFRFIRIEPLHVLLSVHTCMRLYIALDHSPLDFSAFERRQIISLPVRLGNTLGMHYLSGAIFGGGWVIGSLEILGSPSGLARSVTNGLRDFVSLPVQGLFRGPWGFLVGLTHGSTSLVRNITAGTVNSVTKLATSVARNLDRLTLDTEHVQRTDALRRRRPQGMTEGFTQGLTGLGISILGAVGGLAHHPLQARSPIDVVTGVGKGIVGAFTKPISGAAELVALTGQGMLHSVGYNTLPSPKYIQQPIQRLDPIPYKALWEPQALCEGRLLFTVQATHVNRGLYKLVVVAIYQGTLVLLDADQGQFLEVLGLKTVFPTIDVADSQLVVLRIRPELPPPPQDYMSYPISSRTYQFVQESTMQLPKLSSYTLPTVAPPVTTFNVQQIRQMTVESSPPSLGLSGFVGVGVGNLDYNSTQPLEETDVTVVSPSEDTKQVSIAMEDDGCQHQPLLLLEDVPIIEGEEVCPDDSERRLLLYVEENLASYLVHYVNLLKKCLEPEGTIVFEPFGCK